MRPTDDDLRDRASVNARFRAEAEAFGLRFRCEHCAHVDVALAPSAGVASARCSLGYPNPWLVGEAIEAITAEGRLTFCKYFELGEQ